MPKDEYITELLPIKCLHEIQEVAGREVMTSFVCDDYGGEYETFFLNDLILEPMETAALFEFFGRMKNLQHLEFVGCTMEQSAFLGLANLLKKENKIKVLVIYGCFTSEDDAKHVIDALGNENCKVTNLDLSYSELTDESASHLRDALKSGNCRLTELKLKDNQLTDAAAEYLRDALKSGNCKLTDLHLDGNELTDVAAEHLTEGIINDNCKLTGLHVYGNKMSDAAFEHFSLLLGEEW